MKPRLFCLSIFCFLLPVSISSEQKNLVQKSQKAQPFALYDLNDNLVTYSDFKEKKILILSFFATWCEPCVKEIKELEEFSQLISSSAIEILLISTDRGKKKKIVNFVKNHQIKLKIIRDIYGIVQKAYKVNAIPALFLIDKSGDIVFQQEGYSEKTVEKIKLKIKEFIE